MEPCHYMTIKEALEAYWLFDEFFVQKIGNEIFKALIILKKIGLFHGWINTNNIFISIEGKNLDIKISDYGLFNVLHWSDKLSLEEGSWYDIICLGILILKMLGRLRQGEVGNIQKVFLNSQAFSSLYRNEGISSKLTNFLDLCFDERTTLEILRRCPFLTGFSSSSIINEEASNVDSSDSYS